MNKDFAKSDSEDKFWSKVLVSLDSECWPWVGGFSGNGYGAICWNRKSSVPAHRLAWQLKNGEDLGARICRHLCDNPPCCNPKHIVPGAYQDNNKDTVEKGRHKNASKTHCCRGHDLNAENVYHYKNRRCCRVCNRLAVAKSKLRRCQQP